jgi:hypothetical protein
MRKESGARIQEPVERWVAHASLGSPNRGTDRVVVIVMRGARRVWVFSDETTSAGPETSRVLTQRGRSCLCLA